MTTNSASPSASIRAPSGQIRGRFTLFHLTLFVTWLLIAGYFLAVGWPYYSLPLQERPFDPGYDTFKPGGALGLDLGIWGTLCMAVGVLTYSVRKRVRRFNRVGKLRNWLAFHIFLCTLGPFLILLHTSFKVNGLVAISFISMVVVVISGLSGRYLYAHIPKTMNGQKRSLAELHQQRKQLLDSLKAETGMSDEAVASLFPPRQSTEIKSFGKAIMTAFSFYFDKRKNKKWILEQARTHGIPEQTQKVFTRMMRDQIRLERHIALLKPFQNLFKYWITIHVPLTIIMGLIVLLHIGVAFAFGYIMEF